MKKLCFVAAFLMAVCACAQAQDFSKWTVTPRVGFNVSNLVGGKAPGKDSKIGFTGGADVEYRPINLLGVSLGCFFNSQNSSVDYTLLHRDAYFHIDQKVHSVAMQNIAIPLLLNAHVGKGLTVKAGVQLTWWTRARLKYEADGYYIEPNGNSGQIEPLPDEGEADGKRVEYHSTGDSKADCMKTSLTMPVAVSYAYKNVELDVRYLIGAYKMSGADNIANHHPKSLVITIGYHFHMK